MVISTSPRTNYRLHHYQSWNPTTQLMSQYELYRCVDKNSEVIKYEVTVATGRYSYEQYVSLDDSMMLVKQIYPFDTQSEAEKHFMALLNNQVAS